MWHPGMVQKGADLLCSAILESKEAKPEQKREAKVLCYKQLPMEMKRMRTKRKREQVLRVVKRNKKID